MPVRYSFFLLCLLLLLGAANCNSNCDDVQMGLIPSDGSLNAFSPPIPEGRELMTESTSGSIAFEVYQERLVHTIAGNLIGKEVANPKLQGYPCLEYYQVESETYNMYLQVPDHLLYIRAVLTKNVDFEDRNSIGKKEDVKDVLKLQIGYDHHFSEGVPYGDDVLYNHMVNRTFFFNLDPKNILYTYSDAFAPNNITQEYHPTITIDGITHANVYHLYLNSAQWSDVDRTVMQHHPLTYVQGVYLKEGFGVLRIYTSDGQNIDFQ